MIGESPAAPRSIAAINATPGFVFTAGAGSPAPLRDDNMDDLEACVVGRWIHSYEEDTPEAQVYRRPDYQFPPARGRRGFELREGGEAILAGIAPADGSQQATARWTLEDRRVRIDPGDGPMAPVTFEIVSCEQDVLRVKR